MTDLPFTTAPAATADLTGSPRGSFIDRERASYIMGELGLDGLVVSNATNVYHLTRYSNSRVERMINQNSDCMALISKDPKRPIALVLPSFYYYYLFSEVHEPENCAIYLITDPTAHSAMVETGKPAVAGSIYALPDRQQAPLSAIEEYKLSQEMREAALRPPSIDKNAALGKALKDLGLDRGRVGVDEPYAREQVSNVAPAVAIADATIAIQRMRLVKSPAEIMMMHRAARANAEAALTALRAVRAGDTYRSLRRRFYAEAALRGNLGVWLTIDRVKPDAFDATFHDGQAFLIDAVSEGEGYWGDYGRTIFIGEPARSMVKAANATTIAWNGIREKLRPGLRFSEIKNLGVEILRKAGNDTGMRFSPHSVGLYHTDATALGDIVLEAGMIISVDCPVLEAGIGGSAHLEDLTLITEDGHEALNDIGDQIVVV